MNLKRYRDVVLVLLALAVPFWFLRYSMSRDPRQLTGPDKLIVRAITPIQYAAGTLARGLSSIWGDYIYLVDVKEDNTSLAAQNARLRAQVRKLEHLEAENRRLRGLLELRGHVTADVVSAQVISKDTLEFFRVANVTLDRPSREITSDARLPVITLDGVVGTTGKVAGDTVEVKLVVDAGAGVDVVVERSGARGFVRGTGDEQKYLCKVEYVKRTDEVEVGDLLVTSGVGRRFPPGIPVAKVSEVVRREFGIYQTVRAEPTVDMSRLREVLIVVSPPAASSEESAP
ncbi:MAG: rod shape-determining protein MreC [Deltaproteobacteria bacterium]|nr:rod shape-determining protein MreC [Deltaproteobacteria bacterium]MBW2535303.1 rod shape-determining protein MreC [Deltaproteobacteria bacterium]